MKVYLVLDGTNYPTGCFATLELAKDYVDSYPYLSLRIISMYVRTGR